MFGPSAGALSTGIRPELELLLCSARSSADAACSEQIRGLVRGDVDWDRLVELASDHHVLPLVYQSLLTVCPDAVPSATLSRLENEFSSNVARNLALTFELHELLKWLAADEIPAIPFKGPTLASLAYGGLALRQAGDLDVLVHKRDAIRAKHRLISHGFRSYFGLADDEEFAVDKDIKLVRDDRLTTVEIHWCLMDERICCNLSLESLWRNAETTRLAGVRVPCFPTPELVLYLCTHGAKHCWQRLSWVCDIAALIRSQQDMNWDLVMRKGRAIGAERMLTLGLLLAIDLLGAPLAEVIARRVRADETARELAREVVSRYAREVKSEPDFEEMWSFNVRARERRRDRLRCRLKRMKPALVPDEQDFAFLRLPPRLFFLYHGVKPVRLATKYALNPSGFLRAIGRRMGY